MNALKRFTVALAISMIGCGQNKLLEHDLTIVTNDGLPPGSLVPVATNSSAIDPSTMSGQALTPSTIPAAATTAIQDPGTVGTISRQWLQFAVKCAFTSSQSFAFSWTDSMMVVHNENYVGAIGVASSWYTGSLNTTGQEWVTGCLAANANTTSGTAISMRGTNSALTASPTEQAAYPNVEGAFYGNLFLSTPVIYDCASGGITYTTRVCAEPPSTCSPIVYVGICFGKHGSFACESFTSGLYGNCHKDTAHSDTAWARVITSYLTIP